MEKSDLSTTVLTVGLLQAEELVSDLQRLHDSLSALVHCQLEVLKAYGELHLELAGRTAERRFLAKQIVKAEREAARLKLPLFFWRPEPERTLASQLKWRAGYLIHRVEALPDDLWDILREFATDYAQAEIADADLAQIIKQAREREVA